ncbi:hypothetical protein LTS01_026046, partial [Friedmanniomyces endolithicus]
MNENEGLAKALRDHQAQLRQIATGKEEVETSLRSAEQRTGTLDEQMREIHTALDVSKIELAELLAAHHEALTTLVAEREDKADLDKKLEGLEGSLQE